MNFLLFIEQLCKSASTHHDLCSGEKSSKHAVQGRWKPLVLVVPLRLGLSEFNPVYVQGLKVSPVLVSLLLKNFEEREYFKQ
jgi:hypothetical protein